jgi:hypothetical protein
MATTVTLKPNAIDISGSTSGTTTLQATAVAGTTTLTLPAATDTLVGKATTDTLTNKTLTGAVMNGTLGATTPSTVAATSVSYTTTLTGGTGIIAIGTNQIYKDASGNVGIGTSSPSYKLNTYASTTSLSIQQVIQNDNAGAGTAALGFSVSTISGGEGLNVKGGIGFQRNAAYGGGFMAFYNNNSGAVGDFTTADEKMRIDNSGNFLVATTNSTPGNGSGNNVAGFAVNTNGTTWVSRSGFSALSVNRVDTTGEVVRTASAGTQVGNISVTASATAYNTSSDYRLKNITGSLTGAKDFIMALQPKQGTWKVDGSKFVGFLAHEFQEVSPTSVSGIKDAVDADGKPIIQTMQASSSEVMANLIAHIQNLEIRLSALETN